MISFTRKWCTVCLSGEFKIFQNKEITVALSDETFHSQKDSSDDLSSLEKALQRNVFKTDKTQYYNYLLCGGVKWSEKRAYAHTIPFTGE